MRPLLLLLLLALAGENAGWAEPPILSSPSGVANSYWRHQVFAGSFSGQSDPIMLIGYNIGDGSRDNAADSAAWMGMEADFYVDLMTRGAGLQHYQEWYVRFQGIGGNAINGLTFTSDKTNPLDFSLQTQAIAGNNSYWSVTDCTSGSDVSLFKVGRVSSTFNYAYLVSGYLGINTPPSTNYRVYSVESVAGTQNTWRISQTATSGASHAKMLLDTASGGGDPFINFAAGSADWSVGIDNSATDNPFKISRSGALGTTDVVTVTATDFTLGVAYIGSTQALTGAGAANVTTETTKITSTGALNAIALADGVDGQTKIILHDVDGGSFVLTPTTKTGWTTFTSTVVGESITLKFVTTRGWIVTGSYLGAIAP